MFVSNTCRCWLSFIWEAGSLTSCLVVVKLLKQTLQPSCTRLKHVENENYYVYVTVLTSNIGRYSLDVVINEYTETMVVIIRFFLSKSQGRGESNRRLCPHSLHTFLILVFYFCKFNYWNAFNLNFYLLFVLNICELLLLSDWIYRIPFQLMVFLITEGSEYWKEEIRLISRIKYEFYFLFYKSVIFNCNTSTRVIKMGWQY